MCFSFCSLEVLPNDAKCNAFQIGVSSAAIGNTLTPQSRMVQDFFHQSADTFLHEVRVKDLFEELGKKRYQ